MTSKSLHRSAISILAMAQLGASLVACGTNEGTNCDPEAEVCESTAAGSGGQGSDGEPPMCSLTLADEFEWLNLCDANWVTETRVWEACDISWIEMPFDDGTSRTVAVRGVTSEVRYVEERDAAGDVTCQSGLPLDCVDLETSARDDDSAEPFVDFCYENGYTGSVEIEDDLGAGGAGAGD